MKKAPKILLTLGIAALFITCLIGCSKTYKSEHFSPEKAIKIEDIDWQVKDSLLEEERYLCLEYTNNTKYPIIDFKIKFTQKSDVTSEDLKAFDKIKEEDELTDSEVREIYITGYNHKCADPGETVSESPCIIEDSYELATREQFNLMEPDIAMIAFIGKDGLGYVTYYDFKGNTYHEPQKDDGKVLYEWSDSEMSKHVPKPEYRIVSLGYDDEDSLSYHIYGLSKKEYTEYVELLKSSGYTIVSYEDDDSYKANNSNGYSIRIDYNEFDEEVSVYLSAPRQ